MNAFDRYPDDPAAPPRKLKPLEVSPDSLKREAQPTSLQVVGQEGMKHSWVHGFQKSSRGILLFHSRQPMLPDEGQRMAPTRCNLTEVASLAL